MPLQRCNVFHATEEEFGDEELDLPTEVLRRAGLVPGLRSADGAADDWRGWSTASESHMVWDDRRLRTGCDATSSRVTIGQDAASGRVMGGSRGMLLCGSRVV